MPRRKAMDSTPKAAPKAVLPACPFVSEAREMLAKHLCDFRAVSNPARPSAPPGYIELTAHEFARRPR